MRPDCISHTRVCLILVNGSVLSISGKQKINNKCLTVSELIGVGEAMVFITETKHFFESQMRSTNMNYLLKPLEYNTTINQFTILLYC